MALSTEEKILLRDALYDGVFNPSMGTRPFPGPATPETQAAIGLLSDESVRIVLRPYKEAKIAEFNNKIIELQNSILAEQHKLDILNAIIIAEPPSENN